MTIFALSAENSTICQAQTRYGASICIEEDLTDILCGILALIAIRFKTFVETIRTALIYVYEHAGNKLLDTSAGFAAASSEREDQSGAVQPVLTHDMSTYQLYILLRRAFLCLLLMQAA